MPSEPVLTLSETVPPNTIAYNNRPSYPPTVIPTKVGIQNPQLPKSIRKSVSKLLDILKSRPHNKKRKVRLGPGTPGVKRYASLP